MFCLRFLILAASLFLPCLSSADSVSSAPRAEALAGGVRFDPTSSPLAYVENSSSSCSGVLVSAWHVITAGHCITDYGPNYFVYVGGQWVQGAEAYYNRDFEPMGPITFSNSQHDLGMIILSRAVTNVTPAPVYYSYPLSAGVSALAMGYGLTEDSEDYFNTSAVVGRIALKLVYPQMFSSYADSDGVGVCSGDSGGPVLHYIGNTLGVIGISVTSNTQETAYTCSQANAINDYVNLQSASSQRFLSNFPGVIFQNGGHTFAKIELVSAQRKLSRLKSQKDLKKLKTAVSAVVKQLNAVRPMLNSERLAQLNGAIRSLRAISSDKNLTRAKSRMSSASKVLTSLAQLGTE